MSKVKCSDLLSNSLNQFLKEMYGDQSGEFVCGSWDLKGLGLISGHDHASESWQEMGAGRGLRRQSFPGNVFICLENTRVSLFPDRPRVCLLMKTCSKLYMSPIVWDG